MIFRASTHIYLLTIAAILAPLTVALLLNYAILVRAGETMNIRSIAQQLQAGNVIYGSGVHDLRKELKLEIIRERKPDIIAFGSSRPLDFRQEDFKKPFACACQAMSQIDDGLEYAKVLLAIHKPKLVIFAVDFWWFLDDHKTEPPPIDLADEPPLTLRKLFKPFGLITDGTVTLEQYLDLLLHNTTFSMVSTDKKLGLLAKVRGIGIRADGSLLAGVRLDDYAFEYYKTYAQYFARPETFINGDGADRYGPDKLIQQARIDTYREIVDLFHQNGVKVVTVLPPIAPPVYAAFTKGGDRSYIFELPRKLVGISDEFYDFSDPAAIRTNACEFTDQHHAGDTAYMRLLLAILHNNPSSVLRDYVEERRLEDWVTRFQSLTIANIDGSLRAQERDFLRLGCRGKKAAPMAERGQ